MILHSQLLKSKNILLKLFFFSAVLKTRPFRFCFSTELSTLKNRLFQALVLCFHILDRSYYVY